MKPRFASDLTPRAWQRWSAHFARLVQNLGLKCQLFVVISIWFLHSFILFSHECLATLPKVFSLRACNFTTSCLGIVCLRHKCQRFILSFKFHLKFLLQISLLLVLEALFSQAKVEVSYSLFLSDLKTFLINHGLECALSCFLIFFVFFYLFGICLSSFPSLGLSVAALIQWNLLVWHDTLRILIDAWRSSGSWQFSQHVFHSHLFEFHFLASGIVEESIDGFV